VKREGGATEVVDRHAEAGDTLLPYGCFSSFPLLSPTLDAGRLVWEDGETDTALGTGAKKEG
jgi:hypothetical protein